MAKETTAQQEAKWQAEMDARTLAEAEEIRADQTRHKAAQSAAGPLAKEQQIRADGLAEVAKHNPGERLNAARRAAATERGK